MRSARSQSGFSLPEFVIIGVIAAALGFVGYTVYERRTSNDNPNPAAVANDVPAPPPIENASDLDVAQTVLEQNDPATAQEWDESQLDSYLSNF